MITIEEMNVRFGDRKSEKHVVKSISLRVAAGETIGIVGESGCGKSTLLRSLAGLDRHWTGRITMDGKTVDKVRTREQLRLAQMVFQDPYGSIHPRHRVGRILAEPLRAMGLGSGFDQVDAALARIGLPGHFADRFPHELSGGQRQRVAIARALMLEPAILLLDEPTSALDVSIQAEILNLLSDLQEERQLTFVLVSHDLSVIAHMCDRALIMKDGALVDELTKADLQHGRSHSDYAKALLAASVI